MAAEFRQLIAHEWIGYAQLMVMSTGIHFEGPVPVGPKMSFGSHDRVGTTSFVKGSLPTAFAFPLLKFPMRARHVVGGRVGALVVGADVGECVGAADGGLVGNAVGAAVGAKHSNGYNATVSPYQNAQCT
jgi:hypothetical protein